MKHLQKLLALTGITFLIFALPLVGIASDYEKESYTEIKGSIEVVDVDNLTIIVDGETYKVKPEAKIEKEDDQKITLSELSTHLGSRVEIKMDKENTVYEIELEDS